MAVEEVYTNSFDATYVAWIETGVTPYLQDTDADYIRTSTNAYKEGNWSFPASTGSGTINSVKVRFEAWVTAELCGQFYVYVWDGASWVNAGTVTPDVAVGWSEIDVSSILNTWEKINGAKVYIQYSKITTGTCYVRRLTRKVDYTAVVAIASKRLLVGVGI